MNRRLEQGNYYGKVRRQQEFPGVKMTETTYTPNEILPKHYHENPYFCFVLNGNFDELSGNKKKRNEKHSILFHPEGEVHSDEFLESDVSCFNIEVNSDFKKSIRENFRNPDIPLSLNYNTYSLTLSGIYKEFRNFDDFSPLAIEGLMLEFLAGVFRLATNNIHYQPGWLKQVKEIIHERFYGNISVQEIADLLEIHPVHLAREFHKHYKCSIGFYKRKLKIEYAQKKLCGTDMNIAEISLSSGFSDQSHFTRIFKQFTGQTPAEFRRNIKS